MTKFEASKLLMDYQKEKAQLVGSGQGAPGKGRAWLRWPLMAIGTVLALVAVFFLLHLLVMDLTRDPKITAAIVGLTLVVGFAASAALDRTGKSPAMSGRAGDVERNIRLLEDEVESLKARR